MTKQISALKAAVEGGCGLTLNTLEAADLLREMQANDLPLIYADFQSKRTWKDECARLRTEYGDITRIPSPSAICALIGCKNREAHSHSILEGERP